MEPSRDDRLIAELRALRPLPTRRFAAELDERAAAGFPRRAAPPSLERLAAPLARLTERKGRLNPRRLLLAGTGAAAVAIAIATTVVVVNGEQVGGSRGLGWRAAPLALPHHAKGSGFDGSGPHMAAPSGAAATSGEGESAGAAVGTGSQLAPFARSIVPRARSYDGSFSLGRRDVERSAEITLGAEPGDVGADAAKVFDAVHVDDGIVLGSSTREGGAGEAGATFALLVPSRKLGDLMAALSTIDEVRSRHEATADITAPTVGAMELLRESRARIESLLGQLREAETEPEREALEAELRSERHRANRLAGRLAHLHRRARFSRVSVRIVGGGKEGAGGGWGIDDALREGGRVLTVAAAVALVGLAVLAPIALLALLGWLGRRAWLARARARALG